MNILIGLNYFWRMESWGGAFMGVFHISVGIGVALLARHIRRKTIARMAAIKLTGKDPYALDPLDLGRHD